MRAFLSSLWGAVFSTALLAQVGGVGPGSSATTPPPAGSVSGRVTCSDTHLPARMAAVVLQPVVVAETAAPPTVLSLPPTIQGGARTPVVETLLDGSFTIPNVTPGEYYLIAELPGYLSPLAQMTKADFAHPTQAMVDLMASLLRTVTVAANRTATVDVSLVKGGTIAGAVRFDDGMPDVNGRIRLLRKDASGQMKPFFPKWLAATNPVTDDRGQYRIVGLPAGEYLVVATLELYDVAVVDIFKGGTPAASRPVNSLNVYYGNVLRQRDGKTIDLKSGEDSEGNVLEVPLSRLHSVTGSLVDQKTGRPVNSAKVDLRAADDDTDDISATQVDADDGTFRFPYVGEGEYTLKVTNAHTMDRQWVGGAPGTSYLVPRATQAFADAAKPLAIHSDLAGLVVELAVKPAGKPVQTKAEAGAASGGLR